MMSFLWYSLLCLFSLVNLGEHLTHARYYNHDYHNHHSYASLNTINVDPSQKGSFSTIQSAIDSVPSNNKAWVHINVKAGTYREKVTIPSDKPFIILQGQGKLNTFVEWDDHDSVEQSPTFTAWPNNVVVRFISFRNTYNIPKNRNPVVPAVAALIVGNETYLLNVNFYGYQDTLWDHLGTHYYQDCTIEGAVDFIFGTAQSIFEGCDISVIGGGFITAQGRTGPNDPDGFVFKNCNIFGNSSTYLGRPWRPYARVLFYQCSLSNIVNPSGWQAWNSIDDPKLSTFAEYGNRGPGADTSKRVSWEKKLDLSTLGTLTSTGFIDNNGWLQRESSLPV